MKRHIPMVLELAGTVGLLYGLWLAWPPAAYIVGGASLILLAQIAAGRERRTP